MTSDFPYRMPAEWEPHEATWLSWPHRRDTWPGAFEEVPPVFVQIAKHLAESELVRINVGNPVMAKGVKYLLEAAKVNMAAVRFHYNPTNDAWVRDHGPIYVVKERRETRDERREPESFPQPSTLNPQPSSSTAHCPLPTARSLDPQLSTFRERAVLDWDYNAWGEEYDDYHLDNLIPSRIADEFQEQRFAPGMILEGGSIDVNGLGTLLTTESVLLNPNRNPHLTRPQIEEKLRFYLGVTNILWLGDGIEGDDTDGHVDDLTRFVNADTVVTIVEPNPNDVNYRALRENRERLTGMRDQAGNLLKVIDLPMPDPLYAEGMRLPASYANFLIANTVVLVPTYRSKNDAAAIEILQSFFPTRRVVGIDCTALVWGLGSIHCVTQQQPQVGHMCIS
jgi:agmatine deiminase